MATFAWFSGLRLMLGALGVAFLLSSAAPAAAFGVICCSITINTPSANWVGYTRDCAAGLAAVSPADRENACKTLSQYAPTCQETKAHCKQCDPKLYSDYQRKRQVAMELFRHASDLRLAASRLVAEHIGEELKDWGIDIGKDVAIEEAWEQASKKLEGAAKESRSKLVKFASKSGENIVKGAGVAGLIKDLLETTYKGRKIAQIWGKYQEEARKAQQKAVEMWQSALADLDADLKQAHVCLAESRRKAEEERRLDRAKELIEEWDNNQVRYRDPITQETLDQQAALQRALQYLESGRMSGGGWRVMPAAFAVAQGARGEQQQAARAAARELDGAMASFGRLRTSMRAYLRANARIEARLQSTLRDAPPDEKQLGK